MTANLLEPPTNASPATALSLSQQAAAFFKSQSGWSLPYPLSLFSNSESQEKWQTYENLFLACLRTGDNVSADLALEELTLRFGPENERVAALRGLWAEATATSQVELDSIMTDYEEVLKEDPTAFSIRKRRVALLRSTGKTADAITALTNLLDTTPTDAEAWAELTDLYLTQGLYEQAIFSMEEVLLLAPNAWNSQARMGEITYRYAQTQQGAEQMKTLAESMRRFCRSIELCDDYLRGYYGLRLVTNHLLEVLLTAKKSSSDAAPGDLPLPPLETVKKLNQAATAKLAEIVRRSSSGEKGWDGYNSSEVSAARELLDSDTQKIER